jgi:hypothetical protein
MKYSSIRSVLFTGLFTIVILTGCSSIGPKLIPKTRAEYNGSLITSDEQQLLLNIVRMRFEDRPYFVSVDSIVASNSLSVSGGPGYVSSPASAHAFGQSLLNTGQGLALTAEDISDSFSMSTSTSVNANLAYSDSPTVSYTPYQGSKFTTQLLTPVSVPTVMLLLGSGQDPDALFRLVMSRVINYQNAPQISISKPPDMKKFIRLVTLLKELQDDNIIYFTSGMVTKIHKPKH